MISLGIQVHKDVTKEQHKENLTIQVPLQTPIPSDQNAAIRSYNNFLKSLASVTFHMNFQYTSEKKMHLRSVFPRIDKTHFSNSLT